ncbi:SRPBCC family protein [Maritalea sp.]|uniref:SRPBCC family protein n=1 Tax=Maritalea sp. TaxID=2003361 RepID=UPI003EF15791
MQSIASFDLEVERTPTEVFDFISNMENFGEWFPGVVSIVSKDQMAHQKVGKVYFESVQEPFKGKVTIPITVVACQPNEMFQTQGEYPPLWPQMTVELTKIDKGCTRISWAMESRNDNIFFRFTLLLIVKRIMRKRAQIAKIELQAIFDKSAT